MSNEEGVTASEGGDSAERLLEVGNEVRRRRGRPPGSKNRPKDGSEPEGTPKVNETNQRRIFAGAIIALFSILAIFLGWFGYEYHKKISFEDAQEGGTYLLPLSQKIGSIASFAFYLSFPAWMISQVNDRFRKKVETPRAEANAAPRNGVSQGASPSAVSDVPSVDGSPASDPGFSPLPPPN